MKKDLSMKSGQSILVSEGSFLLLKSADEKIRRRTGIGRQLPALSVYQTATVPSVLGSVAPQSVPFSSRRMICPRPKLMLSVGIWMAWPIRARR